MQHFRSSHVGAILIATAMLASCREAATTEPPPPPPAPVASVEVTAPRLTMIVGERISLAATPRTADGNPLERAVTWRSEDAELAAVSAEGLVTALSPGEARIIATSDGREGDVRLTVWAPVPEPVAEVIVHAATTSLETWETAILGVQLKLASGEVVQRPVTWRSTTPLVAVVTRTEPGFAVVQARMVGSATIIAESEGVAASVTVHVSPAPTADLIYSRHLAGQSEIFVLEVAGDAGGRAPTRLNAGNVSSDPSPSPDGTRFAFAVSQIDPMGRAQHDLYVVNRDGLHMRQLTNTPGMEREPTWSPDGTRILFTRTDVDLEQVDIWVVNVDGSGLTNLTAALPAEVSNKRQPAWSPDGTRIAFIAVRGGSHKVWTMDADGTDATPLTVDPGFDQSPSWAPAGDRIAFARYYNDIPTAGWELVLVDVVSGATSRLHLPGDQLVPAWSPDGEHIAVAGTERVGQGPHQLYTLRPDGTGLRLRTVDPSWGGGHTPAWLRR